MERLRAKMLKQRYSSGRIVLPRRATARQPHHTCTISCQLSSHTGPRAPRARPLQARVAPPAEMQPRSMLPSGPIPLLARNCADPPSQRSRESQEQQNSEDDPERAPG